jgi:hypothetical protein
MDKVYGLKTKKAKALPRYGKQICDSRIYHFKAAVGNSDVIVQSLPIKYAGRLR